jgi:hypothetical protein
VRRSEFLLTASAAIGEALTLHDIRQRRTIRAVKYVFNPEKDKANLEKHGVSLALAEVLFAGSHTSMKDDRFEYGEFAKWRSVVSRIGFMCVFTLTAPMSGE